MREREVKAKMDSIVSDAADELNEDLDVIKKVWSEYKSKGIKGLIRSIPGLIDDIKDDPDIIFLCSKYLKNGTRTTEFFLILAFLIVHVVGVALPWVDISPYFSISAAVLISVYIVSRTYIKTCFRNDDDQKP